MDAQNSEPKDGKCCEAYVDSPLSTLLFAKSELMLAYVRILMGSYPDPLIFSRTTLSNLPSGLYALSFALTKVADFHLNDSNSNDEQLVMLLTAQPCSRFPCLTEQMLF